MLLWVDAAQAQQLKDLLRACWLQHEGDEYGAQEYRFKAEEIDPARGGAVAYVAKYISKNIDDFGAVGEEGHFDQLGGQRELIEGTNKARRVTAWASAWGIRQFQAIGQPPVTVWRELRRIEAGMVAGASKRLQRAHAAVHKTEGKRADWRAYLTEQGGAMVGRFAGSYILSRFPAGQVLAVFAVLAIVLAALAMVLTGQIAAIAILSIGLFNSIMFPTIFSQTVIGLNDEDTPKAAALLCMGIVGGAILPLVTGFAADSVGLSVALIVPILGYAWLVFFGLFVHRQNTAPAT